MCIFNLPSSQNRGLTWRRLCLLALSNKFETLLSDPWAVYLPHIRSAASL
jgi:hypothetical protein